MYPPSPDISQVRFVHGQGIRGAAVLLYLKLPDNTAHGRTGLAEKGENKMAHTLKPKVQTVFFV
jgi:hypothetical protein